MRKKRIPVILVLLVIGLAATAFAAGTIADSFLTVSHLDEVYWKKIDAHIKSAGEQYVSDGVGAVTAAINGRVDAGVAAILADAVMDRVTQKVLENSSPVTAWDLTPVIARKGDTVTGPVGAGIMLKSGTANVWGNAGSDLVNTAAGRADSPGKAVTPYVYYLVPAGTSGIVITSDKAEVFLQDGATLSPAYNPKNTASADSLAALGLFRGSNLGYELERAPTRQEALIMLIRLLGEENQALAFEGETSFTDLTGWAEGRRYITYGHSMGYTNGESATAFAQYKQASLEMYLTFVLRALGYDDAAGDFVWNTTSRQLAGQLGLLEQSDLDQIAKTGFLRDHVVKISFHALKVKLKGQEITLGDKLVAEGTVSREALTRVTGR